MERGRGSARERAGEGECGRANERDIYHPTRSILDLQPSRRCQVCVLTKSVLSVAPTPPNVQHSNVTAPRHTSKLPRQRFALSRCVIQMKLLHRNVQRFRGGLILKAHSFVYHSTLGLEVIQQKQRRCRDRSAALSGRGLLFSSSCLLPSSLELRDTQVY